MKMNIINKLAAMAFALAVFTSCDTDAEGAIYKESGVGVAFASTKMNVEIVAQDNGVIKVPVYRGNTASEANVAILLDEATIQENVFSLTTPTVTFTKGEAIAYAELSFGSIDKLGATAKYEMKLVIVDDKHLSPSGKGSIIVAAQRKLTWRFYGTGVYTSELFEQNWPQPIEKAEEGNIYRLPDCITEGFPIIFTLSEDGQQLVKWDLQATGFKNDTYGMVYFEPTGMIRQGNVLKFPMQGIVEYNGGFALLYKDFTETLELPK